MGKTDKDTCETLNKIFNQENIVMMASLTSTVEVCCSMDNMAHSMQL